MSKRGKWPVKRSTRLFWQSFSLTFLVLIAVFALAFGQLVQKPALEERERQVIVGRYGLDGKPPRTQREIAAQCGISRSYVSRRR